MINLLNRKFWAKGKKEKKEIEVDTDEAHVNSKNENTPSSGSLNNKGSSGSSKNLNSQGNDQTRGLTNQNNSSDPALLEKVPPRPPPVKNNPQNRRTLAVTNTEIQNLFKQEYEQKDNKVDIYSSFQQSFSNRLKIDLPLNELNLASLKADVLVSMANDKADILENTLSQAEEKVEEVSSKLKVIITRSQSISEMATVINSKLVTMDEWMETLDTDTTNFRIQISEFFVSFFSLITTIFSLMWFSFKRNTKKYITSKNH